MKYNEAKIYDELNENLVEIRNALNNLSFNQQNAKDKLFNGWVFEQTIANCLLEEFNNEINIEQQYCFSKLKIQSEKKSKGTADLVIESNGKRVFIELKHTGIFSGDVDKYKKYKKIIEDNGFHYLYLSKSETHLPYANKCKEAFGAENVFLLKEGNGDWERFVERIKQIIY
jgi:hypothetical protein